MIPISGAARSSMVVRARLCATMAAQSTSRRMTRKPSDEVVDLTMSRSFSSASGSRRRSRVMAQLSAVRKNESSEALEEPTDDCEPAQEWPSQPELWPTFFQWDVSGEDLSRYTRLEHTDSSEFGLATFSGLYLRFMPLWDSRQSCLKLLAPKGSCMKVSLWIDDISKESVMRDVDEGDGYTSCVVFFSQFTQ